MRVVDAVRALDKRKRATFGETLEGGSFTNDEEARLMLVGSGLNYEDMMYTSMYAASVIYAAWLLDMETVEDDDDVNPALAVQTAWVDGLLTGIIFAGLRDAEEKAA